MSAGMGTKWLAGTLLGLPLAIAACGLGAMLTPGGWERGAVIAVTACLPLWVAVISASVLFRSSRAAWLWLLAGNLLAFGALAAARALTAAGGTAS